MRFSLVLQRAAITAAVVSGLAVFSPAQAQTVTVNYTRSYNTYRNRVFVLFDPTFQNEVDSPTNPFGGPDVVFLDDYAGAQTLTLTGAANTTAQGYCLDILGVLGRAQSGPNTGQSVPFSATVRSTNLVNTGNPNVSNALHGGAAAWLFTNSSIGANMQDGGVTGSIDSAALQLAIWESLYDWNGQTFTTLTGGNISLAYNSGGNFQYFATPVSGYGDPFSDPDGLGANDIDSAVSSAILARANQYLLAWGGQTSTNASYLDTSDVTDSTQPPAGQRRQDLITVPLVTAAPEPGAGALCAVGFVGMVGCIRHKHRRK